MAELLEPEMVALMDGCLVALKDLSSVGQSGLPLVATSAVLKDFSMAES